MYLNTYQKILLKSAILFAVVFFWAGYTYAAKEVPTVVTNNASNVTQNSATLSGYVSTNGGADISEYGFYWGTETTPTKRVQLGSGIGKGSTFSYQLTGLVPGKNYYYSTYAKNVAGMSPFVTKGFSTMAVKPPVITSPRQNALLGMEDITVTWTGVPGAADYGVSVRDVTTGENGPLLSGFPKKQVSGTSFSISKNLL